MFTWTHVAPAITASFLGSFVELVEAFTIILAAASVRGWKPALTGAAVGFALLVVLVAALGPAFTLIPVNILQIIVGLMLLLFGTRWLRKAILRGAGYIALHDEDKIFAKEAAQLKAEADAQARGADFIAGLTAFKGMVLEGVEVVFIVIAVGAGNGLLIPASLGALAAAVLVILIAIAVHKPLSQVPENTLKYAVGIMLSAFGTFWMGEGIGVDWPGADLIILAFVLGFFIIAVGMTMLLRNRFSAARVTA
jgi:uncharacterized membrane protein